jgi:hypothetical protein
MLSSSAPCETDAAKRFTEPVNLFPPPQGRAAPAPRSGSGPVARPQGYCAATAQCRQVSVGWSLAGRAGCMLRPSGWLIAGPAVSAIVASAAHAWERDLAATYPEV